MSMTLNRATIAATISAPGSKAVGIATVTDALALSAQLTLTNGTSADQADQTWHGTGTISASGSVTIDLSASTTTDSFGQAVAFVRIKAIMVVNVSAIGSLTIGGAASNAWVGPFTNTEVVRAGGVYLNGCTDATAFAVVNGATDKLKITNNTAADLVYRILIVGSTA